jgi:hypothetical protein
MVPDYGSTMTPIDVKEDEFFDPDNTYYLKEESLTPAQRWRKIMLLGVPIIAALMIVGAAALFLLRDFGTLYPGPSGDGGKSRTGTTTTPIHVREDSGNAPAAPHGVYSPEHAPTIHKKNVVQPSTGIGGATACSAHVGCSGLIGDCCPSDGGIFLECCN